jgi:uncharacterized SAM-binding protein YcdF (DUF218 family)
MFWLKKMISPLFYPLPLCLILMLLGLSLLWFTKRQKSGKILVSVGVVVLTAFSYGAISDPLLKPLERTFPPLRTEETAGPGRMLRNVKWIIVLGGGHTSDPWLPVTGRLSLDALARLTEAARLYRSLPGTKLILSGGAVFDPVSEARIYFETARIMDIPASDLVLSEQARDTEEEARFIHERVGADPLILVTSASHMPRAVALFRNRGMDPIPAPSAHLVKKRSYRVPGDFFPSALDLHKAQVAVHEYLGMAWSRLRNRI